MVTEATGPSTPTNWVAISEMVEVPVYVAVVEVNKVVVSVPVAISEQA